MSEFHALENLVADLRDVFRRDPHGAAAAKLLEGYARAHDDWRPYAFFEPGAYTRNLIELQESFELLLLCWESHQHSPIHNHEGQNCWMAVLDGTVEEVQYAFPRAGEAPQLGSRRAYQRGRVAFIRDEIGLHVVQSGAAARAVSLHLYSRPFAECNVYCDQTGRVARKKLGYHSIRGRRLETAR